MPRSLLASCLLAPSFLLAASCTEPGDLGSDERPVLGSGGCPLWGCTGNSSTIGPYESHDLDLDGAVNDQGVRIESTRLGQAPVTVKVKRDQLYAIDANGNVLSGAQLTGLTFVLSTPTDRYRLIITHVSPKATSGTRFWLGNPDRVETYELKFTNDDHPADLRPVCANPPAESDPAGQLWANRFESVVFTGDRYDGAKKLVTAADYASAGNWINLGCAGSVIAKLHLNRHTMAGSDRDHQTKLEQRQAMLKMYTGDFCGKGYAFTRPGTPLHWEDELGWNKLDGTEIAFESWWDEHGASCITTHRIDDTYLLDIQRACDLPACEGHPFPLVWDTRARFKTAIPHP